MSHDSEMAEQTPEITPPPASLVKEAASSLAKVAHEFFTLTLEIEDFEEQLAARRRRKASLIQENPWLGNAVGALNKEASKIATDAYNPKMDLDQEEVTLDQYLSIESKIEEADPKAQKIREQKLLDAKAKLVRARLKKKILRDLSGKKSASQFLPGHPSFGKH